MPFNMNTFSKMWGISTPAEAKAIIEEQKKAVTGEPGNLEEQAISLVGTDIYQKLVKGYTEKQWGRDCKDLPAFIIRRLPVRFTYDNNYFNDLYQGIPIGGYNVIMTSCLRAVILKPAWIIWNTGSIMMRWARLWYTREPLMPIISISLASWSIAACDLSLRCWMRRIIRVWLWLTIRIGKLRILV